MALNFNKGGKSGKYFYLDEEGVDYGPFEISELLEKIDRDTLVYFKGINWTKASEIPELKRYFPEEVKVVEKVIEDNPNSSINEPEITEKIETGEEENASDYQILENSSALDSLDLKL